ncbi:hypothetical protein ANN_11146 [Periplaneta americana]|uniref:Uncharacterized protein n=1 Tax=Periplaneta americana TaxID=6978 RepID=A0ABQ8T5X3_PERAM|nr:hypothetical protein ANN_11146 [Periplaneta americana]
MTKNAPQPGSLVSGRRYPLYIGFLGRTGFPGRKDYRAPNGGTYRLEITVHFTEESRPNSHSAECAPCIMAVDLDIKRQRICLTWSQAIKGNTEGRELGPVLWIEFGIAQWSERLKQFRNYRIIPHLRLIDQRKSARLMIRRVPCDYDLFPKLKNPLREKHYNTRDAIIHAVAWPLRDINRYGRADDVRCLLRMWQKMVNMGGAGM